MHKWTGTVDGQACRKRRKKLRMLNKREKCSKCSPHLRNCSAVVCLCGKSSSSTHRVKTQLCPFGHAPHSSLRLRKIRAQTLPQQKTWATAKVNCLAPWLHSVNCRCMQMYALLSEKSVLTIQCVQLHQSLLTPHTPLEAMQVFFFFCCARSRKRLFLGNGKAMPMAPLSFPIYTGNTTNTANHCRRRSSAFVRCTARLSDLWQYRQHRRRRQQL